MQVDKMQVDKLDKMQLDKMQVDQLTTKGIRRGTKYEGQAPVLARLP